MPSYWSKTSPNTGTKMVDTATLYPNNWAAIEDWLDVEHYTFTGANSALSGKHRAGTTPVMSASGLTTIEAITGPGSGAIGWDTGRGQLSIFQSGGWDALPGTYREADFNGFMQDAGTLYWMGKVGTPGVSNTFLYAISNEESDPYNLYYNQGVHHPGKFICNSTGKYFANMIYTFAASSTVGDMSLVRLILESSTTGGVSTKIISANNYIMVGAGDTNTSIRQTFQLNGTFELTATDYIEAYVDTDEMLGTSGTTGMRATTFSIKRIE